MHSSGHKLRTAHNVDHMYSQWNTHRVQVIENMCIHVCTCNKHERLDEKSHSTSLGLKKKGVINTTSQQLLDSWWV